MQGVADAAGVSVSQVEWAITSPSLGSLASLTDVLLMLCIHWIECGYWVLANVTKIAHLVHTPSSRLHKKLIASVPVVDAEELALRDSLFNNHD